ncbi:hypothetical protein BV98_001380 [Sphingobium herbicidovorans NBRC 16415]|uniref:PIN domain-containing protein n=1 Tax=Sphingobium herbicidovorans (strain ATCC 700291 / DSM 11019 / CCUG 56400 / KCTC 2939 / LMG 18315 / NBRC 16415 / MH) TaxID=1219045 RepID=A0A086PBT1_SPHHM|nr:PIN domain-containing protein [Sphingobium herbicidovorans]KFG90849.1 hypothetical protein BV98_001380 [Sphingobium herbicidovorans NBRC 16415]
MFANRYTALIEACTLVIVPRRDLLLTLAGAEFFRVRWSPRILAETRAALEKIFAERRIENASARAERSVDAMQRAFPEPLVDAHASVAAMTFGLPDMNDEHVLTATVQTQAIVTETSAIFQQAFSHP